MLWAKAGYILEILSFVLLGGISIGKIFEKYGRTVGACASVVAIAMGAYFWRDHLCANGLPSFCPAPVTSQSADTQLSQRPRPQPVPQQQRELVLQENPASFDRYKHNELRHYYSTKTPPDLRKAMEESDIILQHALMDNYILHILSGWQIDKDSSTARANLLMNVQAFPGLPYLTAASYVKVGDLYAAEGSREEANEFYRKVAGDKSMPRQYRGIAEDKLGAQRIQR